jgi:uncharacterized protein (TIGR03437 family)
MHRLVGRFLAFVCLPLAAQTSGSYQFVQLSASSNLLADYVPANQTLVGPIRLAVDPSGNVYFSEVGDVRRITPQGIIESVAGYLGSEFGCCGDGGPALLAGLTDPYGLAIDPSGNIWIADSFGDPPALRRIGTDGIIQAVEPFSGYGLAVDSHGNVYVPSTVLYKVTPNGAVTSYPNTDAGDLSSALYGLAVDSSGNVYAANPQYHRVLKIAPDGQVITLAGNEVAGSTGDGGPAAQAQVNYPYGVALDSDGNLYFADYSAGRVRQISTDGTISTVAGGGPLFADNIPATQADIGAPTDVAVDSQGNLYIASGYIFKVTTDGIIHIIAGLLKTGCCGDGAPISQATFSEPQGMARDAAGNLYIADAAQHKVRKVAADLTVTTLAGTGEPGFSGDGPAQAATLNAPQGVSVDNSGQVYIADTGNNRIRRIGLDGAIQTIAGEGGSVNSDPLAGPVSVLPDASGNIWIADTGFHRIRRISPDGSIVTIAGNGMVGYTGDGGPAAAAELEIPQSIALDSSGNLYIADPPTATIRKVSPSGIISTFAGVPGQNGFAGDGGPAAQAVLDNPFAVAVDRNNNVLIADTGNYRIRKVTPDGVINSISPRQLAGTSTLVVDDLGGFYFSSFYGSSIAWVGYASSTANPLPPLAPYVPWYGIQNGGSNLNFVSGLDGAVAPGMIASIYGQNLGPNTGVSAGLDSSGKFGDSLAGVQVFFGGSAAPILYAQAEQLNVIVPFEVAGLPTVAIYTVYNGLRSNSNTLPVLPVFPAFLAPSASDLEPTVQQGSVLTVFATGGGLTNSPEADGLLFSGPLPQLLAPVTASFDYYNGTGDSTVSAPVLYAGPAPGLVSGVLQVNIQIPPMPGSFDSMPTLTITVGGASARAYISVSQGRIDSSPSSGPVYYRKISHARR